MSTLRLKEAKVPSVQFVGDDDVLSHILDREGGTKLKKEKVQLLVNPQKVIKKAECELEKSDLEVLEDQNYVEVLGRNIQESLGNGSAVDGRNKVYSFQHRKHPEEMTKLALELAKTSGKIDPLASNDPKITKNIARKSKASRSHCDSESEYSASSSEDDEEVAKDDEEDTNVVRCSKKSQGQNRLLPAPVSKEILPKKRKRDKAGDLVEEYFEAHSSSKVLTSDRTLQKLRRARVDQVCCEGVASILFIVT